MIIIAKFGSTCPRCGESIDAGSKVAWVKGSKAEHVECSARRAKAVAPPRAKRAPATRRTPRDGESVIQRRSAGRGDGYTVDSTLYLVRSGEYVTVVSEWTSPPCEDMGHYKWMACAIVRPATEAERAECVARRAREQRRNALAAIPGWLVRQVQHVDHCTEASVPSDAWRYSVGSRMGGSETLYVGDGAVWYETSSYDYGPLTWCMPVTPEQITMLSLAIEALS